MQANGSQIMRQSGQKISSQTRDALEKHIFEGPSSVRERDAPNATLGSTRTRNQPAAADGPYIRWPSDRKAGGPKAFQPTGSFQGLRDAGKLSDLNAPSTRASEPDKKMFIPGYTGFIRGMQHISGRTYGEATRRSMETSYRENVCTSPIPSSPQNNLKIRHQQPADSFVSHEFADRTYHVPGYTGFVPGIRSKYAKTYGSTTSTALQKHSQKYPRAPARQREGYAYTMRPRDMLSVDSAPLPGQTTAQEAPGKLIPAHLRYLKFFAM